MVEFIEDSHTYLVDGIIKHSVTELVNWVLKTDFSGIPSKVLERKAQYGTEVHQLIQAHECGMSDMELSLMRIDPNQKAAVHAYEKLKTKHKFKVKAMEQIVTDGRICGRYDILTERGELIDIKTTYRLNTEYLSWQLGLYYFLMGMRRKYGFVMWLPKQTDAQFIRIEVKTHRECEELINAFLHSH